MKCVSAAVCLLAVLGAASAAGSGAASGTPLERVVTLLKDLETKIEADGQTEQQVYDKYACWCEKTSSRKAASIKDGSNDLRALGQGILKLKGKVATRTSEIAELAADIKENKATQAKLTAIREKENGAFMAETTEMKEVLLALQKAITVLNEGTMPSSLIQQAASSSAVVKSVIEALPTTAGLKPKQLSLLSDFAAARGGAGYAPQSWTVQGILKDMYETFSADLESKMDEEAKANRNFETVIADKTAQMLADESEKLQKEGEKAEAEEQLADTSQNYDDTDRQMKADIAFFDATKASCEAKHSAWVTRSELRAEEMKGIKKALEFLSSDTARELFAKAITSGKETGVDESYDSGFKIPSFLQVRRASSAGAPVAHAYSALKSQATQAHSLRLAALAVQVREAKVGHFDKVLMAIDTMIGELEKEGAADIAKRDQCKEEYLKINSTVSNVMWLIEKNQAKIDKLSRLVEDREAEKAKTQEEIESVTEQIRVMDEVRKAENAAFLAAKADDTAAIELLLQTRQVLASYYTNNSIAMGPIQGAVKGLALSQQPVFDVSADQAPDAVFSGKGSRKGEAKDILSLLSYIIEDLDDEIKNGMKAEETAQLDFEKQRSAAVTLKNDLIAKKTNLKEQIAMLKLKRVAERANKTANEGDLKDEMDYKKLITPDCDWIIGAFEKRADRRASEMQGLVAAKEYLAGYSPPAALLEKNKKFDDNALSGIRFLGLKR